MPGRIQDQELIAEEIENTIDRLHLRISDRFPGSGLAGTCLKLKSIAAETRSVMDWIARPNYWIRWGVVLVVVLLGAVLVFSVTEIKTPEGTMGLTDFVTVVEAGLNTLVLMGAGIVFLITFENRRKRGRVVRAVNRLRSMAHIIDAHQLTKDPEALGRIQLSTENSPKRKISEDQLGRYLDYCSEMLSLASKIGFLYVQNFDDPQANVAVNELDNLTNGLSRKIWQKIIILDARRSAGIGIRK